jgi:hypothetical protein
MKSAYELALERMASRGIEPPDSAAIDDATREKIAEVRRAAEAKLAEAEILHRDRLAALEDPVARGEAEEEYAIDRRRIEDERDRKIRRLKSP